MIILFAARLKSLSNSEHLEKKMSFIVDVSPKLETAKSPVSENPSKVDMFKGSKNS